MESNKVQTRKVITKQEADTLIREIPAIQAAWVENEKLRENVYKEAIKSCDLRELVKIIKNMYLRRQERISSGKKATVLDDRYFKLAEDKLYSELVFATGKDRNQIEKQIEQQAAQCIEVCFIAKWFRIKSTSLNKNSDLCFFSDNLYDILIKDVRHNRML